ncbi:hypothetical protein G7Y89_g11798 [Cudoniella acicularis]|uniref:Heterokaryon incompatibility domain-containing protein n=1 Tax=Cudoniella acicularis TaxID=354080 RepID=A0A8H4RDW1_9HELO|nr:hypothetical protein G7Y89_g11798 [Cudoniella acicularis]
MENLAYIYQQIFTQDEIQIEWKYPLEDSERPRFAHHQDIYHLVEAAKNGCTLSRALWKGLTPHEKGLIGLDSESPTTGNGPGSLISYKRRHSHRWRDTVELRLQLPAQDYALPVKKYIFFFRAKRIEFGKRSTNKEQSVTIKVDKSSRADVFASQTPSPLSTLGQRMNTGSPASLEVAKAWIEKCIHNHSACKTGLISSIRKLPTRLLRIGLLKGSRAPTITTNDKGQVVKRDNSNELDTRKASIQAPSLTLASPEKVDSDSDVLAGHPNSNLLYKYKPLDAEKDEIRLLQLKPGSGEDGITCELVHASMSSTEFKALSYTWGDTKSVHWVNVDGCFLPCTLNLHAALLNLRSTTEELTLWVDAICINQHDVEERSHQVRKMRHIYRSAAKVLVWLGPSDEDSTDALALIMDLNEHSDDPGWIESKIKDENSLEQFYALCRLFDRDYWHRVWVVQEVECARSILVHCGSESIEWRMIVHVQEMLNKGHRELLADIFFESPALCIYIAWWGPEALRPTYGDNIVSHDLFSMLLKHVEKRATDPRDKIYALVGMSSASHTFPIDYSSPVREVYTNLVYSLVNSSQSMDITCALPKLSPDKYGLPSWVPDWSMENTYIDDFFDNMEMDKVSAAGSTRAEVKFMMDGVISTRGCYIDTVQRVGQPCEMKFTDDFDPALRAFQDWWVLWKSLKGTSNLSQQTFVRTLLCNRVGIISSGLTDFLEWALKALSTLAAKRCREVSLDPTLLALAEGDDWEEDTSRKMIWISTITAYMMHRRFFVSSSGIAGLAPMRAAESDKICVIFGCSVPVILRPIDGYHILIGTAYVDGYMTGEALDCSQTQEFEIH